VSVVANVAINVDSSGAVSKLRQVQQGAQATSQAVDKLNATTAATSDKFKIAANGIKYFTDAAGRARAENGRFLTTAERAAAGIKLQGDAAQQAAGKLGGLRGAVGGLRGALVSIGAGALVAGMVRGAAAAEQLQLRLKLLSREYGETERVQQFVAQSAKTFGQSQVEAAAGVADVYARLRPLGTSLAEIETVYKGFNAVALASGTSAEAASGAFLQLSQALGSGRLQGDEFRSIAEQVPGILKLVANEMGVTVGQLKQLGSEGKITSDVLINALAKGFEENKSKISELLALSPAQRFKEFKDSTQALSNAMGSELLPAIVPVVKVATELLRLFGQLPGPMKTIIAAAIGLTAAFVALAPAISATIGLLGGLSLATLAAAGPWIALAAGITAAAVALASYRTESEKIGAKAAKGDPAAMSAARGRMVTLEQEIALMKLEGAEKASPRSALGGSFANAKAEFARLKRDVTTGETAAATPTPTPTPTPTTGTGTGKGAGKGKDDAARIAEQIRASKLQLTLAQDIFAIEGRLQQAQLEGNKQLVLARNAQKELAQIASQRADIIANKEMPALEKKNVLDKLAIDAATVSGKLGFDLAKIEQDRTESFDAIIADLNLELELKTATTEQAREQLRLEAEIAKIRGDKSLTDPQKDEIERRKRELAAPKTDRERLEGAAAGVKAELDTLTDPINMITTAAAGIGDAFSTSFKGIISGSMTAKEALASFFTSVADMFLDMAAQIIAKMITMAILNQILGVLPGIGGAGSGTLALSSNPNVGAYMGGGGIEGITMGTFGGFKANGGPVSSGQTYMVGERGPELFVPGRSGTIVANDKMGGGSTNVVVNVDAKGSSVEGNEQGANQLGRVISAAVQSELIKQQRPGGILAR
jgi:tape measure domain-containing protein